MDVNISSTKVKLAWREKYITEGANQQALAHPRGIYRGFWLASSGSPDTYLRLVKRVYDHDQFAVYANRDDGYAVSVRETSEVEFDCASLFPVGGGGESWYVYLKADYAANSDTDARYYVEKTDPHDSGSPNYDLNAVILGVIPMAFGTTVIDLSSEPGTLYDRRVRPEPTAVPDAGDYLDGDETWGLLGGIGRWCLPTVDQKYALDGATAPSVSNPFATQSETTDRIFGEPTLLTYTGLSGTVYLQLTGKYYIGKGAVANSYFELLDPANLSRNATRSSNGNVFYVSAVRNASNTDYLNPAVDADTNGFYTDPYLVLYCPDYGGGYTGNLVVRAFKYARYDALEQAPAYAMPVGGMARRGHADLVATASVTGSPDSLSREDVGVHLASLLSYVNARIKTTHPTASPSGWVLLWRSHNVTSDGSVTKTTSSIYFGSSGLLILQGGYVSGTTVVAGTGTGDVSGHLLYNTGSASYAGPVCKSSPTAGTSWNIFTGWDTTNFTHSLFNNMTAPIGVGSGGTNSLIGENNYLTGENSFNAVNPGDAATFNQPVTVAGGETATFNGPAVFQDEVDFNDPVDFNDTTTFVAGKTVTHDGPVISNQHFTFNDHTYFNEAADFNDDTEFNGSMMIFGGAYIDGSELNVSADSIFDSYASLILHDGIELADNSSIREASTISQDDMIPLLLGTGARKPAIYWSQYGIWICSNCLWSNVEKKWYAALSSTSGRNALALLIGGYDFISDPGPPIVHTQTNNAIILHVMSHEDTGHYSHLPASGWMSSNWSSKLVFGQSADTLSEGEGTSDDAYTLNGFIAHGNIYERLPFSIGGAAQSLSASGHSHEIVVGASQGLMFANNRDVPPPTLTPVVASGEKANVDTDGTRVGSVTGCTTWGCYVYALSVELDLYNSDFYSRGYVEAY